MSMYHERQLNNEGHGEISWLEESGAHFGRCRRKVGGWRGQGVAASIVLCNKGFMLDREVL